MNNDITSPEHTLPIIHLNGSGKDNLLEDREAVYSALCDAEVALRKMAPNGRDYYPDPGRMTRAEALHRARQEHLRELIDAIMAEVEAICDLTT